MEIPVIHEKTSRASSNKPYTSSLSHTAKDDSQNASVPTSYGYSRSFSMPFSAPSSSLSSMVDKLSYDDTKEDLLFNHLTNKDLDIDHVTDNFMAMMMTNDDLSSFHSNFANNNNAEPQGIRSLHTRLPSTDSGIQADAGFDSLSRYKGKHLLSSTNAAAVAAAAAPNPVNGGTTFNQHPASPTSHTVTSPNDSNSDSISPQEISSSGYGSDIGVSSPISSFSPPASISPSIPVSLPVSAQTELNRKSVPVKPVHDGNRVDVSSTPTSSLPSTSQIGKPIHRQGSVPAVPPKPRVSLSRKPAFLNRGASTLKPSVNSNSGGAVGGGMNNKADSKNPPETLSLSSGIKVTKKEDGVEVCISTKPASSAKNSECNVEKNNASSFNHPGASSHGSQYNRSNDSQTQRTTMSSDSHNSSIDILSPDGSSVKIQVVKSGLPSFSSSLSSSSSSSSPSSSYISSSSSTSPSYTNSHPQTSLAGQNNQTSIPSQDNSSHLTRSLRFPVYSTTADSSTSPKSTSSTINTSPSIPISASTPPTSTKTPTPRWRSNTSTTSIHNPLISSYNPTTAAKLHHPSEKLSSPKSLSANIKNNTTNSSKQNQPSSLSDKLKQATTTDPQKTVHHIPIKKINVSQSVPKTLSNAPLYTNVRGVALENTSPPVLDNSKTTPISVITNTIRSNDKKTSISPGFNRFTTSTSTVISSPPPTIVMSPSPSPSSSSSFSSSASKTQTQSPVIDSCIFRFKSPETSIFKQTFYDNDKPTQSSPSPSSSPQQQKQSPQPHAHQQLLRPTYLPTSNRTDFLKKNLKSSGNNGKTTGTSHPGVVLRRTDDIIKEALDFFNSRDDDDWDKLFSKSSFFDDADDDMEKIFSKCWKTQDHDEFDKLFSKVFKRRKGSSDVDTRFGVSVDGDDDEDKKDRNCGGSYSSKMNSFNRWGSRSCADETTKSKTGDGLDNVKPRDVTSPNSGKDAKSVERSKESSESWKETKRRMDSALSWLQHELADLRAMDKRIVSQFRRCQDTIESLQAQREVWEGLEEETEFWDDMEISEFNRRCQESPGSCSLSPVSTGSRDVSMSTSESIWNAMRNGGIVIQDVEATL